MINRISKILFVILSIFSIENLHSQEKFSKYRFDFFLSGGASIYSSKDSVFESNSKFETLPIGLGASLKVMWQPDNLLNIGFESGFVRALSASSKDSLGKVNDLVKGYQDIIPILLVFGMRFNWIDISSGIGFYNLSSKIYSNRTLIAISDEYDMGFMFSVAGEYDITPNFAIGCEAKIYSVWERQFFTFLPQISLRYSPIIW